MLGAYDDIKRRYRSFSVADAWMLFAVYVLASLFYALRHGQPARKAVDATLVFGTPIVAFGPAMPPRDSPRLIWLSVAEIVLTVPPS
mgnify:CR=1 FL=1